MKVKSIMISAFVVLSTMCAAMTLSGCDDDPDVYVCMSKTAERYHKTEDCWGLNRCKSEVRKMRESEAKKMFKTPCKLCLKERYEE